MNFLILKIKGKNESFSIYYYYTILVVRFHLIVFKSNTTTREIDFFHNLIVQYSLNVVLLLILF